MIIHNAIITIADFRLSPDLRGDMIVLVAESSPETNSSFIVPKASLMADSPVARAAFSRGIWSCNTDKTMVLPKTEPETAQVYAQWLISNRIYSIVAKGAESVSSQRRPAPKIGDEDAEWTLLISSYFLGDYMKSAPFCNAVATAMKEKWRSEQRWPLGYAAQVYANTTAGSKLRKMIVDFHIYVGRLEFLNGPGLEDDDDADPEFIFDILAEVKASGGKFSNGQETAFFKEGSKRYLLDC